MDLGSLQDILILLAVSVVVAVFRRLNLPPVLGYLFVGLVVGPHALAWLGDNEATRSVAEIGVVFLLFTIGLEFSIPQFLAMRKTLHRAAARRSLCRRAPARGTGAGGGGD
jgi:CPA2 family monovalent cation:H+ antiporter-2